MNKDQWYNVLEFSRTVNADLSNYDEDGACTFYGFLSCVHVVFNCIYWMTLPSLPPAGPVMLDEFVEWHKARNAL